jgi:hypothetical protein
MPWMNKVKEFTDSGKLRVSSRDARHVEDRQEGLISNSCDHHLHWIRGIDDALKSVQNRRENCLARN